MLSLGGIMKRLLLLAVILLFSNTIAQARVYRNLSIGEYEKSFNLRDFKGQSFLSFMKEFIYPSFAQASTPRFFGKPIQGVREGVGVELRLSETVSTYHVKYLAHWDEKAERSGRSFAAVDSKPWNSRVEYVADASYKHYLSTLEDFLEQKDEMALFYQTLFEILLNCDPSGVQNLSIGGQQVLGDFVAVYVAEQYRHLVSGKGESLGLRHNWDNAHLQVTLLAAFHAGQTQKMMYYKGRFVNEVYHQQSKGECHYRTPWNKVPESHWMRPMNLTDYWQFNKECDRSGVNLTRKDFKNLGSKITPLVIRKNPNLEPYNFLGLFGKKWTTNYIDTITRSIVNNRSPNKFEDHELRVEMFVHWILEANRLADEITTTLKN